jgi:carboxyl-terminal processing protease
MKRILILALALFCLIQSAPAQQATRASYAEVFEAVWQTVDDNFYDPAFGGVDWKAMRGKYSPEVAKVRDDAAFLAVVDRMLGELKVSHLYLRPAQPSGSGIAVKTRDIDGKRIVYGIAPASDASVAGVRIGDELLTPVAAGPIGSQATIRVRRCDGTRSERRVRRERAWWPPEHPSLRWRSIEQAPGRRIGYIKSGRFDDDAAPLIDSAMSELKDTAGLIIDVRDNSGGNLSALRLVSYLIPEPRMAVALLTRTYLDRQGSAPEQLDVSRIARVSGVYTTEGIINAMKNNGGGAAFYSEKTPFAYTGKVVVLINSETGSAGEGFAWMMRGLKSVTLVGGPTAGVLLGGEPFNLPGGWVLTVPTHASWGPDGKRYVDQSVHPDVEVRWTRADLCEQRDPDIARALEILR